MPSNQQPAASSRRPAGLAEGLAERVALLRGRQTVVVGDVILDEYLFGRAERLSREAAIPVLEFRRRQLILGGAANPAQNITALGSAALQVSVVGGDQAGEELLTLLAQAGVDGQGIVVDPSRPTTVKLRVLAEVPLTYAQQLARLDRLDRRPIDASIEEQALDRLRQAIPQADLVLCSDYRTGFLTERLIDEIRRLCRQHATAWAVDSQGRLEAYRGADLLRCNADEAAAYLGRQLEGEPSFRSALDEMLGRLEAQVVIVTRGSEGFSIQGRTQPYAHIPALPIGEVFDATGAGDTFIAVAGLGLAAALPPLEAARLANVAAGLVVRHIGNAVVRPEDLRRALQQLEHDRDHQT